MPAHALSPPLTLRVPASTSNLGTGFDSLGLALGLFLELRVEAASSSPDHVLVRGEGTEQWPDDGQNHLLRAFERARACLGGQGSLRFSVQSEIPLGRGLGSSGAAIAAGLLLAAALAPQPSTPELLLELGIELEGHPDNVAASLLGGCTLCLPAHPPVVLSPELSPALGFALAWPELRVDTARARAVLPEQVPHRAAVENARRLPVLLEGLRRADPRLLALGIQDELHVARRLELIPGGSAALSAGLAAGAHAATVSGSGSCLIAITAKGEEEAVAAAMCAPLREATGEATARSPRPALDAPVVQTL